MPIRPDPQPSRGIALPPRGWVLALLLALYILPGLTGHDPWKVDDAVTLGVVHDMVSRGNWLLPQLAGRPWADAPLYYWIAAGSGQLFAWLLPLHDAARLASGAFTLLALSFILLATRELHGRDQAASGPLILAGSIGFIFHAHEAQPMLAALTAHAAAYWGLAMLPRLPRRGAGIFGAALGGTFLAGGVLPALLLLPVALAALWRMRANGDRPPLATPLLVLAAAATAVAAPWLLAMQIASPSHVSLFWRDELRALGILPEALNNIRRYLGTLAWYAWPALPIAAWALWSRRRMLRSFALSFPLLAFLAVLLGLGLLVGMRSAPALLLLPPLVLLAVPGVAALRRGAANAFDWFAMITFSLFAGLVWIGWCAMVFGWPPRLARQVVRLAPGFETGFSLFAFLLALAATLAWLWLIVTSPRSPMRSVTHWMAGVTLFWFLVVQLWMPWIDYGKTYRPLAASIARSLPADSGCIADGGLPESMLASLDYFEGIRLTRGRTAPSRCDWLLVQVSTRSAAASPGEAWQRIWEGHRPNDRHERFRLYRRAPAP